ncbi:MAG: hypothetical protein J2P37_28865 [Ktedonobacteraceae bacterium]|nr:hypothetical protein [Ktedonobacteraceae bacterium]
MKRILFIGLFLSVVGGVVAGSLIEIYFPGQTPLISSITSYLHFRQADTLPPQSYNYYVLKEHEGFVLARAPKGNHGQPLGTPQLLQPLGNDFGLSGSDSITALYLSPDAGYLAINGNSDHGEMVWVYNTRSHDLRMLPQGVAGNFLRWLPGAHSFLYRPMLPLDPAVTTDGTWNPGLWVVDAASGTHTNIDIGVPSAELIDAAPSPDGSRIVYSTSAGLGQGSYTYTMRRDGSNRSLLFAITEDAGAQNVAGLFSWSPNGMQIAYERLTDSTTPFLKAGLWVMNAQGGAQRRLADADGGHGFTLSWSPDSRKVAFIARTNFDEPLADIQPQALQCAVAIADVMGNRSWLIASTKQTGLRWNINPTWANGGTSITFTALNPVNQVLGGMPRYWSAPVAAPNLLPAPLTQTFQHIVAMS